MDWHQVTDGDLEIRILDELTKNKRYGSKAIVCLNFIRSIIGQVQEVEESRPLSMPIKQWTDRMKVLRISRAHLLTICRKLQELGTLSFSMEGDILEIKVKNIIFGDYK